MARTKEASKERLKKEIDIYKSSDPGKIRNRAIYKTMARDQKKELIKEKKKVRGIGKKLKEEAEILSAGNDETASAIGDLGNYLYNLPPINTENIEEIAERCSLYFGECQRRGLKPNIEGLGLALGVSRMTLNRWERGENGTNKSYAIKKAKQFIAYSNQSLVMEGKLNPVAYIFISKNVDGYTDQTINLNIDTPLGNISDSSNILERLPGENVDNSAIEADFKDL